MWPNHRLPHKETRVPRPNIVLILADDMGYGDIGAFGHEAVQTPALGHLAAEGVVLTQHYSGSPVCAPAPTASRPCSATSRPGSRRSKPSAGPSETEAIPLWGYGFRGPGSGLRGSDSRRFA